MICENSIEIYSLPYVKQIMSVSLMQELNLNFKGCGGIVPDSVPSRTPQVTEPT